MLGNYDIKNVESSNKQISYSSYNTKSVNPTIFLSTAKNTIIENVSDIASTISGSIQSIAEKMESKGIKWSTKGVPTPRYYQSKMSWSKHSYGGKTISKRGCGCCALAMAVTALTGKEVTPPKMAEFLDNKGIETVTNGKKCVKAVCKEYGLKWKEIGRNKSEVDPWLENGAVIMMSIKANGIYTGGGHYILCTGKDSDGYYVQESGRFYKTDKAYKFSQVFSPGNQGPFVIYK